MTVSMVEHKAELAKREAERAFHLAKQAGDLVGAVQFAFNEQAEAFGALGRDVESLRKAQEVGFANVTGELAKSELRRQEFEGEIRGGLARLELKLGTRTAISLGEEAVAKIVGAQAEASLIQARTQETRAKGFYAVVLRIFAAVGAVSAIGLPILAGMAARGCSVIP
jgi:hypothetical protein